MPCIPIHNGRGRTGFVCFGNEPVTIHSQGRDYLFEWTEACGWMPCNKDGSQRLTPVPEHAWDSLDKAEVGGN